MMDVVTADSISAPKLSQPTARVLGLALAQLLSWGALCYSFPVALGSIASDTGWGAAGVSAPYAAGLAVTALAAPAIGHAFERFGPRVVMTVGALCGGVALALMAIATALPIFWLAWVLGGFAISCMSYSVACAIATSWFGGNNIRALTIMSLAAGLSTPVFAPITFVLVDWLGWRGGYWVMVAIVITIVLPLQLAVLPRGQSFASAPKQPPVMSRRALPTGFIKLAVAISLGTLGVAGAMLTLVPLLEHRGMSSWLAATAYGVLGLAQLLGRIGYEPLARLTSVRVRLMGLMLLAAIAVGALALVPGPEWVLILAGALVGVSRGLLTLVQATSVSELWGPARYAVLSGYLALPAGLTMAVSPWVSAELGVLLGSPGAAFLVLAAVIAVAAVVGGWPTRRASHR